MITLFIVLLSIARADSAGDAWLARIDDSAKVDDAHLVLDVVVTDARGREAPRTIEIWQKGDDHRLVRMVAPSRLKGVGLLVSPGDSLHLFLPQYPPSRRVVGSKRADAFMGTDFAVEDLSRMNYTGRYDAKVMGSEGSLTQLDLTPRQATGDSLVRLWVDDKAIVHRIEHLGKKGAVTRRLILGDVRDVNGTLIAHEMAVEDVKRGRKTVATIRDVQLGAGLSDELFTVTNLERP